MPPPRRTCLAVLLLVITSSVHVEAFVPDPISRNSVANLGFKSFGSAMMRTVPVAETDAVLVIEAADTASSRSRSDRISNSNSNDSSSADIQSQSLQQIPGTKKKKDMVQMSFLGEKSVTTPPVPLPSATSSTKTLDDFFANDKFRNLLFFRNDVTKVANPTREMMDRWSTELKLGGGQELDGHSISPTQNVIQIKTSLSMPGLKILTINTIGTKLLLPSKERSVVGGGERLQYPEYQFTLFESELLPEGAPPLVWLFNKLIRFRDTTSSFTRVRVKNAGAVNGDKIVFTTEARLETRIQIPSKALKAMPGVNADKFERQGSKSIQKLLEKELEPALLEFRNAYVRWIES